MTLRSETQGKRKACMTRKTQDLGHSVGELNQVEDLQQSSLRGALWCRQPMQRFWLSIYPGSIALRQCAVVEALPGSSYREQEGLNAWPQEKGWVRYGRVVMGDPGLNRAELCSHLITVSPRTHVPMSVASLRERSYRNASQPLSKQQQNAGQIYPSSLASFLLDCHEILISRTIFIKPFSVIRI